MASTGYVISHWNYYAYRLAGRYVYVVASEAPSRKPNPARPSRMLPADASFHLLTIELTRGAVVQDVRLTDRLVAECQIEDVDERAVLVSLGEQELRCYRRVQNPGA